MPTWQDIKEDVKYSMTVEDRQDTDYGGTSSATRQGGRRTGICDRYGSELLKKNMARHRGTCGVHVMRKRKRCQYCRKDLTEGFIKKHAIVCKKKQDERVVDRKTPELKWPRFKIHDSR